MERSEFYAKLDIFIKRVQDERNDLSKVQYPTLDQSAKENGRVGYHMVGYDDTGSRFVRVWDSSGTRPQDKGRSVTHFVEKATGIIFGAKGWKAYNPIHEYGTLDTIDEWDWSGYYAKNKAGKKSIVPKALRK